jgi:hypothetical protein
MELNGKSINENFQTLNIFIVNLIFSLNTIFFDVIFVLSFENVTDHAKKLHLVSFKKFFDLAEFSIHIGP